MKAVLKNQGVA